MDTIIYEQRNPVCEDIKHLKNQMTLDLNREFASNGNNRRRAQQSQFASSGGQMWTPTSCVLLESPDIKMCKLGTPELESIIISHGSSNNGLTPTPSLIAPPSVSLSSDIIASYGQQQQQQQHNHHQQSIEVTEAQKQYVRGFEDALQRLRSQDVQHEPRPTSNSSNSSSNGSSMNTDARLEMVVCPPMNTSPPVSPINMADQERIKLERKRLRNRIAASKCRRRKLEKIARLEEKVSQLKSTNAELTVSVRKLRDHVCHLKEEVMLHVNQGCQLPPGLHHL